MCDLDDDFSPNHIRIHIENDFTEWCLFQARVDTPDTLETPVRLKSGLEDCEMTRLRRSMNTIHTNLHLIRIG
uniref:AlNc14C7G933 protein n=1 Tax=Albugo laibachii Nc14 TaxID=890382 RepID=F0W1G4_9STRA|nr:AlNc14C7G933 [Albugo laibachii Nc14]|eukprot:CCA14893.1 AlNc14C7G933 [Albugo laibachii Nc14]